MKKVIQSIAAVILIMVPVYLETKDIADVQFSIRVCIYDTDREVKFRAPSNDSFHFCLDSESN